MADDLHAPFPYFGGKSRAAHIIWPRFGDVRHYIEPFAGSLAVLLARPGDHQGSLETVNDVDCHLANFWRSVRYSPEEVIESADWPVNEADLHARHCWLVEWLKGDDRRERFLTDPDYHEPKVAGWWLWGISQWIGGGWCELIYRRSPEIATTGRGVHAVSARPSRQKPAVGTTGCGTGEVCNAKDWPTLIRRLSERLRYVRVCCGDWARVVTPCVRGEQIGPCGVLLDPPYSAEAGRYKCYANEDYSVAHRVREWCAEHGGVHGLRIALCGYEGEGHEELEQLGWSVVEWKAQGGYARGDNRGLKNRHRERIWFSPGCLEDRQISLFDKEV